MNRLSLFAVAVLLATPAIADEHLGIDGRDRTYWVFRPTGLGRDHLVPLVVVLHGGFGTGRQAEKSYRWDELAQTKGLVVVYPDGYRRSWNAVDAAAPHSAKMWMTSVF